MTSLTCRIHVVSGKKGRRHDAHPARGRGSVGQRPAGAQPHGCAAEPHCRGRIGKRRGPGPAQRAVQIRVARCVRARSDGARHRAGSHRHGVRPPQQARPTMDDDGQQGHTTGACARGGFHVHDVDAHSARSWRRRWRTRGSRRRRIRSSRTRPSGTATCTRASCRRPSSSRPR